MTAAPGKSAGRFTSGRVTRWSRNCAQTSEHPVAKAIAAFAQPGTGAPLPEVTGFESLAGRGARGLVDGREVVVGRPGLLADRGFAVSGELAAAVTGWQRAGHTAVLAGWDGTAHGGFALADEVKPTAAAAVAGLRRLGLRTLLLSGDTVAAAATVAEAVGVDDVIAGAMPGSKAAVVEGLQDRGRSVAMVGDGVNDAPALTAADLGIALGTGTNVAISAADIIVLRDDLQAVTDALMLARATMRTIRQNLGWAFGYNIVAIPIAAAGFCNPLIAGAAMAFSSAFVVSNSVRLRRFGAGPALSSPWRLRQPERPVRPIALG